MPGYHSAPGKKGFLDRLYKNKKKKVKKRTPSAIVGVKG
jgi:hypothetical protein|tara:strand:+ start:127 stop:243 length:117 start_codon:yes stop_codon:yes gene_type:complete